MCDMVLYFRRRESASNIEIRLGGILETDAEPGVIHVGVSRAIPYPYYNRSFITGDIALLKLSTPVTFTDTIRPVCLPSRDVNVNRFKVCVATGFGRTDFPTGLQHSIDI